MATQSYVTFRVNGINAFYQTGQVTQEGGVDSDYQAFINATGITDTTIQSAINTLITDLKAYGLWSKLKAFYPIVGGSATTHKFNLKDPRDLDAAYRLTFFGGLTHDSNGILGNGTNAYAYTNLPQNTFGAHNMSAGWYNMNDLANFVNHRYAIGGTYTTMEFRYFDGFSGDIQRVSGTLNTFTNNTTQKGMYILSRQNSTQSLAYKNGTLQNTTSNPGVNDLTNRIIPLFAKDNGAGTSSAPSVNFYGNWHGNCIFFADGMNGTEVANISTAINKFNSTLNRNVFPISVSDSDAQSFLNAANITNSTQANAINTLVSDLKSGGIWTKMKAIYPFVGGTAFSHKFNLKDPRDLDAAYRLTFAGGITHSTSGLTFNGANGFANTKIVPSSLFTLNSNGLGIYMSSVNSSVLSDPSFLGSYSGASSAMYLSPFNSNTQVRGALNGSVINSSTVTATGLMSFQKTSATTSTIYRNTTSIGSGNSGGTLPSSEMLIGCLGISTGQYNLSFVNVTTSFVYFSDGLNSTEATALYNAIQAYQTTLGRQV